MGPPAVSLVLVLVVLGLTATLPGPLMVQAERNSAQDLLDDWLTERDTRLTEQKKTSQNKLPKDCQEVYKMGSTSSGVYRISPQPNTEFDVYCEQEIGGGGWTVFQQRKDGSVDFFQDWNTFKQGFGNLTGEFWLGNTNIHLLTKNHDQRLKVELMSDEGEVKYANYAHFWISDELDKFRLHVTGFKRRGILPGDSLSYSSDEQFSTKDNENYGRGKLYMNATIAYEAAWWYGTYGAFASLNGLYGPRDDIKGIWWINWKPRNRPLKATRMMIRKRS